MELFGRSSKKFENIHLILPLFALAVSIPLAFSFVLKILISGENMDISIYLAKNRDVFTNLFLNFMFFLFVLIPLIQTTFFTIFPQKKQN